MSGVKLLVVDDNEMNLMVIGQYFDNWKIQFDEAKNGLEAVELVKKNQYDVVLMDLQMPIMDGYEAVKKIRSLGEEYISLPIIALSASVSNEVVARVTEHGMDDYLSKPFDPLDLYNKINTCCKNKSEPTQISEIKYQTSS